MDFVATNIVSLPGLKVFRGYYKRIYNQLNKGEKMVYYNYKKIGKDNAFTKSKLLKWTVAFLNNKYLNDRISTGIDILFNHLSISFVKTILKEADKIEVFKQEFCGQSARNHNNHYNIFNEKKYSLLTNFLEEYWRDNVIDELKSKIFEGVADLLKEKENMAKNDRMNSKLRLLQKTFKLSNNEINGIVFLYILREEEDFEAMLSNPYRKLNIYKYYADTFSELLKIKKSESIKVFSRGSSLYKLEFVNNRFELQTQIIEYLNGFTDSALLSTLYKKSSEKSLPLKAHSIRKKDNDIIKNIILNKEKNKGVNILLYGLPGTGKTEYIRSLATDLKYNLYEILSDNNSNQKSVSNEQSFNRYTSFFACQNTIPPDKSIILIDEADELLNGDSLNSIFAFFGGGSRNSEKNKINELLDTTTTVNFWITNHFKNIDASTRRRFDYSIQFKKFDYKQRLTVWKSSLKKHNLSESFKKNQISNLAEKYEINAGGIDIVLRNYKRMPKTKRTEELLISLIKSHLKIMRIESNNKHLNSTKKYTLKHLNIQGEHSISDGLDIISEFSKFMRTADYKNSEIKNMNLLLYGHPGTGKTEFVKFMAKKINRKLIVKQGSDFLGMYVGETEQNIKNAFAEAEQEGAILFIDEADGLLFDRGKSQRSFEMTQVNEILTQMENFRGIFVCSSNFRENMDRATFRRFNLKFEFDYLTQKGVFGFYKTFLSKFIDSQLTKIDKKELAAITGLTPGDFKVVEQKYIFFKKKKLTHQLLINALKEEVRYKQTAKKVVIGFKK